MGLPYAKGRTRMMQMSGRRRARATSLLLVLFASISLGVCTAFISAGGGKLPCCAKAAADRASLTTCCPTGQQSSSELPVGFEAQLPQASEDAFLLVPPTSAIDPSRRYFVAEITHRSADTQALLSTFLI